MLEKYVGKMWGVERYRKYIWKYNIFFVLEMMNIGRIKHCTCGNKFQGICSKTLVI